MTTDTHLTPHLIEAIESLAMNVLASAPFILYRQASQYLHADVQARDLLNNLATTQAELRGLQVHSLVRPEDIARVRALQDRARANPLITAYLETQQTAIESLRETNLEISQLLGVDFSDLARQSGCC